MDLDLAGSEVTDAHEISGTHALTQVPPLPSTCLCRSHDQHMTHMTISASARAEVMSFFGQVVSCKGI